MGRKQEAKLLMDHLVRLMCIAEDDYRDGNMKSGEQKKKWVMDEMRKILVWDDSIIDELLLIVIDKLIEVDNGKLRFHHKVKKSLFCCFK